MNPNPTMINRIQRVRKFILFSPMLFHFLLEIHADSTDDKSNARLRALNEREREQEILKQHEEREIRAHR